MPWHLSEDLKRFKQLTMGHHIIMGRKTHESIGRLLPGRTTIVISRNPGWTIDGAHVVSSLRDARALAASDPEPFIIGGGQIYREALPFVDRIYLTRIETEIEDGDTFFPDIDFAEWTQVESTRGWDEQSQWEYTFEIHERNRIRTDRDHATAAQ